LKCRKLTFVKLRATSILLSSLLLLASACSSSSPKSGKVESVPNAADPAPADPVPQAIRDQLLTPEDIKDGAKLQVEVIPTPAGEERLLISGDGPYSCSPTGNCDRWIFRRTAEGYPLEIDLGSAQEVNFKPNADSEFPDVEARQHGSATRSELRLYQYKGNRYQLTKCMEEDYQHPTNPERILEKPILTETPCNGSQDQN
jgi:hypothetical protein